MLCGVLAALGLLLGLLPLFGWLNWFFVLPPALLGVMFGALSRDRSAMTFNIVILAVAALRLLLGGGVI